MNYEKILQLDPIIHSPIRLAILSILITVTNANFTFLKESTETTDGNLSTHLTKLEESNYIMIKETRLSDKKRVGLFGFGHSLWYIHINAFINYKKEKGTENEKEK